MSNDTPTPQAALYELRYNATHPNSYMTDEGFEAALAAHDADKDREIAKGDHAFSALKASSAKCDVQRLDLRARAEAAESVLFAIANATSGPGDGPSDMDMVRGVCRALESPVIQTAKSRLKTLEAAEAEIEAALAQPLWEDMERVLRDEPIPDRGEMMRNNSTVSPAQVHDGDLAEMIMLLADEDEQAHSTDSESERLRKITLLVADHWGQQADTDEEADEVRELRASLQRDIDVERAKNGRHGRQPEQAVESSAEATEQRVDAAETALARFGVARPGYWREIAHAALEAAAATTREPMRKGTE